MVILASILIGLRRIDTSKRGYGGGCRRSDGQRGDGIFISGQVDINDLGDGVLARGID